jgi:hypothetical protein
MPPSRTIAATTAKRKPLPFKPPRLVDASTASNPATAKRAPALGTSSTTSSRDTQQAARKTNGSAKRAALVISSDEEESDEVDHDVGSNRITDNDHALEHRTVSAVAGEANQDKAQGGRDDQLPPIPQKLLARLLYESFEDKNTKVGKDALAVFGKYIEVFVREGLARAAYEREKADLRAGSAADGFLQVLRDLLRVLAGTKGRDRLRIWKSWLPS